MVKTPINVFIRARPTVNYASKNIIMDETNNKISINIPKQEEKGYVNHQQENWGFQFDKVLQNASQEVIFDICGKNIVSSLLDGYSGTILAYGQTGAGKTFTMFGSPSDYKYRGIIPRVISLLFQEIQSRYDQSIVVRVSYLEIYNELMGDLLGLALNPEANVNLAIQEDERGSVNVKGLMRRICNNEEEAFSMLFEGETNRTISEHKMNKTSTRSHCIFTIYLEMRSRVESSEKVIFSKLNLVDLAGSERTKKTGSEGQTLIEAQFINKSLSFLEQVVVALSEKQREHIPYRQSKLTNLLKDSIGGNCKTTMIANIWPESNHLEETISTLKFASRMMKVSNEATINVHLDPQVLLKKYEKEIRELKQELAMHDTLANRGRINYEPYPTELQYQQQVLAKKFLEGEIEDLEFESLRQVKELFFQFKNIYKNLAKDIKIGNYIDVEKKASKEYVQSKVAQNGKQTEQVGVEENKYGFGLGKANKDAKPLTEQKGIGGYFKKKKIANIFSLNNQESLVVVQKDDGEFLDEKDEKKTEKSPEKHDRTLEKRIVNVDRNQVYLDFKEKEGKEYNDAIIHNNLELRDKKKEVKLLSEESNKLKDLIEMKKDYLKKKQEGKNQEEIQQGIIDEEEFGIIKELKEFKKEYKTNVEKIKNLKSTIVLIEQNIHQCKHMLFAEFEKWFKKKYGIAIGDLENPLINAKSEENSDNAENEEVDQDALTYIKAKKKVMALQKARKQEKSKI